MANAKSERTECALKHYPHEGVNAVRFCHPAKWERRGHFAQKQKEQVSGGSTANGQTLRFSLSLARGSPPVASPSIGTLLVKKGIADFIRQCPHFGNAGIKGRGRDNLPLIGQLGELVQVAPYLAKSCNDTGEVLRGG